MNLYLDFPIGINQDFKYKTVTNALDHHKKNELHAHNAKQIDYKLTTVHNELVEQSGRINRIVDGHNGDGVAEVKDSRNALDGSAHPLLSRRLKYEFEIVNKAIIDNYNILNKKIERIINVNDFAADPTGKMDSTHIKANANKNKYIKKIVKKDTLHFQEGLDNEINEQRLAQGKKPLKIKRRRNIKPKR